MSDLGPWISIKDKMPAFDENLLVRFADGSILANIRRTISGFTSPRTGYHYNEVTHWLRLPPPPDGEA